MLLVYHADDLWLRGIVYGEHLYKRSAQSECHRNAGQTLIGKQDVRPTEAQQPHTLERCRCGFHVFKTYQDVLDYELVASTQQSGLVIGEAVVWGNEVLEGTIGYRASAIDIKTLRMPEMCSSNSCQNRAVGVGVVQMFKHEPPFEGAAAIARCQTHATAKFWTIADIAATIGVSVEQTLDVGHQGIQSGMTDLYQQMQLLQEDTTELLKLQKQAAAQAQKDLDAIT